MKKIFIICILIIPLFAKTNAQTAIGLKAGIHKSTLDDNNTFYNFSPVLRTNVGAVVNFEYSNPASFQLEVNYARKGGSYLIIGNKIRETYGFLEIPFLLKVGGGNNTIKFFGVAGPFISIPLRKEIISFNDKEEYDHNEDETLSEVFDAGFHLGLGVAYKFGPGRAIFEYRYGKGFGNDLFGAYNTKIYQCNIGYVFTFRDWELDDD